MKIFFYILILLILYFGFELFRFSQKVAKSKIIILNSKKYELLSSNFSKKILVLGDSTGFGVGASKAEDTIAGLLSKSTNATYVENLSVSGAQIKDLETQLNNRRLKDTDQDSYDIILIQIGGNDIIRFHSVSDQKLIYENLLKKLPAYKKLISISVGDVGDTTLFPFFIRPLHSMLSAKYHQMFEGALEEQSLTNPNSFYINLSYTDKTNNPFLLYPEINLSADGLHPSSAGYKLWFEKIVPTSGIEPESIP